jgi:hypothetical protein
MRLRNHLLYGTPLILLATSAFDPDQFAQQEYAESNDTIFIPADEGEFPAVVKKHAFRHLDKTDQVVLDITWSIDDAAQRERTGREDVQVRQSIFLDRTEAGGLDFGKGKNVSLGKLREAVGLNVPGQPFRFDMLVGRPAVVKIKNRKEGDDTYSDIKGVRPLQ